MDSGRAAAPIWSNPAWGSCTLPAQRKARIALGQMLAAKRKHDSGQRWIRSGAALSSGRRSAAESAQVGWMQQCGCCRWSHIKGDPQFEMPTGDGRGRVSLGPDSGSASAAAEAPFEVVVVGLGRVRDGSQTSAVVSFRLVAHSSSALAV